MEIQKESFKGWLEIKKLKQRSIIEYLSYLEKLSLFTKLNQEACNLFLIAHNNIVARAFLKNYLDFLIKNRDALNLSKDDVYLIKEIELPKVTGRKKTKIPKVLTVQEVLLIEKHMQNERNKLMVLINFYGGLRIDEIIKIKPYDFSWKLWKEDPSKPGHLKVIGKGDKERVVFIPPKIMFRIESWIRNYAVKRNPDPKKPLFVIKNRRWRQLIYQASKEGLGRRINPHMLRHSCASWLLEKGWDIRKIQDYLGHESITSTQIYTHVNKKTLEDQYSMALNL